MHQNDTSNRNFNTISPSAKTLLLMKGHTDIPYARQTAEIIQYPENFIPDFSKNDMTFWARTVHFENRYRSIDQLMSDLDIDNILELSSGYSFRGLDFTMQKGCYYIDTDLPDMITMKKELMKALKTADTKAKGKLELLPLNALDEKQFYSIVNLFPAGEIVIVNEGLLMYLNAPEKEKLCGIIHKILEERGGYWITADIYLRNQHENLGLKLNNESKEFFEQHRIEDNKFGSFKEAEDFFRKMGFVIDKEAEIDISKLSSLKYFLQNATSGEIGKINEAGKIQTTWRLRIAGN